MNKPLMTAKEVAAQLQVTAPAVRKYIKMNKLRAFKIGRQWRVAAVDFERFKKQNANMGF